MPRFCLPAMSPAVRRWGASLVSCLALTTLVACGGGTQSKKFVPESMVVFGDEMSLIKPNGAKYAINTYRKDSTTTYSCNDQYLWIQVFALDVNFQFRNECPDWTGAGAMTATMLANDPQDVAINATSADTAVANAGANAILTTINNNLGLLNDKTLVTVTVGRADVVKAYLAYQASPDSATLATQKSQLKTLGGAFAAGLAPVVNRGARLMVFLTPDLGYSPLAAANAANVTALHELTAAFNEGLEFGLVKEGYTGQQVARVDFNNMIKLLHDYPSVYSSTLADVSNPACKSASAAAPLCLTNDAASLAATDATTTYLWADATHLNTSIVTTLSSIAYSAYVNHPF